MFQVCAQSALRRFSVRCLRSSAVASVMTMRQFSRCSPTCSIESSSFRQSENFHLLKTESKAGRAEELLFDQQVQDVKQWWASPRYEGIKRSYSPEDVVSKRGSLQQVYPSSLMARKLFDLLKAKSAVGEPVHTSASNKKPKICGRRVSD